MKEYANGILKKYFLFPRKDKDGYPMYEGGISPLWNGRWNTLKMEHFYAVTIDIVDYYSSVSKKSRKPIRSAYKLWTLQLCERRILGFRIIK